MKTELPGRLVAVLLVPSMALLQGGCRTGLQKGGKVNAPTSVVSASSMVTERSRVEALVRYVGQPSPFTFRVEDETIGTDVNVLIGWLQGRGVTDVVLDSEFKLTSEGVRDLVKQITQSGIVVREFWIPRSTPPGRFDVLGRK